MSHPDLHPPSPVSQPLFFYYSSMKLFCQGRRWCRLFLAGLFGSELIKCSVSNPWHWENSVCIAWRISKDPLALGSSWSTIALSRDSTRCFQRAETALIIFALLGVASIDYSRLSRCQIVTSSIATAAVVEMKSMHHQHIVCQRVIWRRLAPRVRGLVRLL